MVLACVVAVAMLASACTMGVGCKPGADREGGRRVVELHSDHDGVPDHVERQLGLDPESADTDMDGLSDFQELMDEAAAGANDSDKSSRIEPLVSVAYAEEQPGSDPATGDVDTIMEATPSADATEAGAEGDPGTGMRPASPRKAPRPDWDAVTSKLSAVRKSTGRLSATDPWRRGIAYAMTIEDIANTHARTKTRWTWKGGDIPTVEQYVAAFKSLLGQDASTPAPCVDEMSSGKGFPNADPDLGGGPLTTPEAASNLAQSPYPKGFLNYQYTAKIHNGLCDADGDGIPTFYEAYGYTLTQESGIPGGLKPWGFKVTGTAKYVVVMANGDPGPFWGAWGSNVKGQAPDPGRRTTPKQYYPGVVTGSGFEMIPVAARDYKAVYLKTDGNDYNSDGDADTDDEEAGGDTAVAADRAPWNNPAVAGSPSFRLTMTGVDVAYDKTNVVFRDQPDWLDETAKWVTQASPVVGTVIDTGVKIAPLLKSGPAAGRASGAVAASSEDSSSGSGSAMLSGLASALDSKQVPNVVGQIKSALRFMFPKKKSKTIDWSRATLKDPTKPAGTATLHFTIINDARVDAVDVVPGYTLMLGDSVVGAYASKAVTLRRGDGARPFDGPPADLSLEQLKAAETGGAFSVITNVTGGQLHKRVGTPLQDVSLGDWNGFRSDIDKSCATVVFDRGNGYFDQYQIAATHDTTVRDAFFECLRDYSGDGVYQGLALRNTDPQKALSRFQIGDLGDWAVVFDARMDSGKHYYWTDNKGGWVDLSDKTVASSLDFPLVARSIVHFIHKDRMNTKAVFADARMSYGGGIEHKSLTVTLANRSECVSNIDVYFLPDGDKTKLGPKNKMATKDDGVYTMDLPSYKWTGKEKALAALRGFDGTVTTDPYAITPPPPPPNLIVAYSTGGDTTYSDGGKPSYNPTRVGYVLGTVDLADKSIAWGSSITVDNNGTEPAVCLNRNGTAVLVYLNSHGDRVHRVGNLDWDADGWTVAWGPVPAPYDTGTTENPSVDMDDKGTIVEMHTDKKSHLWTRLGIVNAASKSIAWGSGEEYDSGGGKSIALAPNGTVRQIHRGDDSQSKLFQGEGTVDIGAKKVNLGSSSYMNINGSSPAMALNANGVMWAVHKKKGDDRQVMFRSGAWNSGGAFTWRTGDTAFAKEDSDLAGDLCAALGDDGTAIVVLNLVKHSSHAAYVTTDYDGYYRIGQVAGDGASMKFVGDKHSLPSHEYGYADVSADFVSIYSR